jgi:plastocyanin
VKSRGGATNISQLVIIALAAILVVGDGLAYVSISNSGGNLSVQSSPTTGCASSTSSSNTGGTGSSASSEAQTSATSTNAGTTGASSTGSASSTGGGVTASTSTTNCNSTSTGSGSSSGSTITIPQGAATGLNFAPASLTVAPGTTITWDDQDSLAQHNVAFTSVPSGASTPGTSPNLQKGSTFQVTLSTPGTYHYECQYHSSWMLGTITVT